MAKKRETLGANARRTIQNFEAKAETPKAAVDPAFTLGELVKQAVEKQFRDGLPKVAVSATSPPATAPSIPTALNEQQNLLESLAASVDALALRLDVVLSKSAEKSTPVPADSPVTTHILSRIYEHSGRVSRIDARIRELLETLLL